MVSPMKFGRDVGHVISEAQRQIDARKG